MYFSSAEAAHVAADKFKEFFPNMVPSFGIAPSFETGLSVNGKISQHLLNHSCLV